MQSALAAFDSQLKGATRYSDVFGSLPLGTKREQERQLKKKFVYLARTSHPDRAGPEQALAGDVLTRIIDLHERAKAALAAGRYEEPFASAGSTTGPTISFTGSTMSYTCAATPFREGDFSLLYRGVAADGTAVVVKVAAEPSQNQYLEHEVAVLSRATGKASVLAPFLPELLDTFLVLEAGNIRYRANVYRERPGFVSLKDIRTAYQDGLPQEAAAWVWRRVLGQTLAAAMLGVVNGALVPEHVLVHPKTHEPLHLGWAHAVIEPHVRKARLTTVIDRYRDWYPPEVFAREVPTHQTDLYMAGKAFLYLTGGDVARDRFPSQVPSDIVQVVKGCLVADPKRRAHDGALVLRQFTDAVRGHWGRTYRPLIMPNT